jgi:hypothetical protein
MTDWQYLWWWSYLWDAGSYFPPTSTTISHVFKTFSSLVRIISASPYSGNCFNIQHANTSSQWNVPLWVPIVFLEFCFFVSGSVAINAMGNCFRIVPILNVSFFSNKKQGGNWREREWWALIGLDWFIPQYHEIIWYMVVYYGPLATWYQFIFIQKHSHFTVKFHINNHMLYKPFKKFLQKTAIFMPMTKLKKRKWKHFYSRSANANKSSDEHQTHVFCEYFNLPPWKC